MNRFSKVILILLIAGVVLAVGALVGAKFYAESDAGRGQLEAELSKALKIPLRLGKVEAGFLGRLKAQGVSMPAATGGEPPLAQAGSVRANIRMAELIWGNFAIDDLVLEQPTIAWAQNEEGRWVWPGDEKKKGPKPEKTDGPAEPKKEPGTKVVKKESPPVLTNLKVTGATVHLLDAQRRPVVIAETANIDFTEIGRGPVGGTAVIAKLTWTKYAFEDVRTTFRYAKGALTLDDLMASLFNGEVRGDFAMEPEVKDSPFTMKLELTNVSLNALATAAGWQDGEVAGKLSAKLSATGSTKRFARLEGPGSLTVENGRFKRIEMFESIAHVLELAELTNLQPTEAYAKFSLRDEKAFIEELALGTANLRITAKGEARFDDEKLKLEARLTVTERLAKTMQDFALDNFTKQPDGQQTIDFKVSGLISKPKTDLSEKLIGGKVKDKVEDLLSGLFGTKPKEKEKEKDKEKEKEKEKDKDKDKDKEKKKEKSGETKVDGTKAEQ